MVDKRKKGEDQRAKVWISGDVFHNLIPLEQFKKREKHPWKSVTIVKVEGFLYGCFWGFLYCTNVTKLLKASHLENGGTFLG